MRASTTYRNYLIGAVIVWIGVLTATILTLEGTDQLATMLIIEGGAAFWFIALAPQCFRQRDKHIATDKKR